MISAHSRGANSSVATLRAQADVTLPCLFAWRLLWLLASVLSVAVIFAQPGNIMLAIVAIYVSSTAHSCFNAPLATVELGSAVHLSASEVAHLTPHPSFLRRGICASSAIYTAEENGTPVSLRVHNPLLFAVEIRQGDVVGRLYVHEGAV